MGLDSNGTKFLLYARSAGVSFQRTAMLGRQSLHLGVESLRRNLAAAGSPVSRTTAEHILSDHKGYAEDFLKLLGAQEIRSFDATTYEEATDIHDFNFPIEKRWNGYFDVVLDGGCLEHVFNFPVAIRNCMEMLRPQGFFLGIPPANNFFGHGFYQFSPELFFRVLSLENGFSTRMFLLEDRIGGQWLELRDPAEMHQRGTLVNRRPTYLLIMAQKTTSASSFTVPQQSDYQEKWEAVDAQELRGSSLVDRVQDYRWWSILSTVRDRLAWLLVNQYTKGMVKLR